MTKPTVLFTLAGNNSRFHPFNTGVHKSGLTLLGKPLVVRTIEAFQQRGYSKFVIVISPKEQGTEGLHHLITQQLPDTSISFVEQPEARGMGDAVLAARDYLHEEFIYTFGYNFRAAEIADKMLELPFPKAICTTKTEHPWDYGIVTSEGQVATGLVEKPPQGTEASDQKIQSVYKLDHDFIERLGKSDQNQEYNFESTLNECMQDRQVGVIQMEYCLASLKYPWHVFDMQSELFEHLYSHRDETARISTTAILDETEGPIWVGAGAVIRDYAKICGPAYIGTHSLVGDYAFIRQSSIESHSQVGAKTEVVRSIILNHSSVHFGYLADSVIGNHVQIGAGILTANKRLDRQPISVEVKGQPKSSGRTQLGVMIGDGANLGIGVKTMPGVIIGSQATIFPSTTLFAHVANHETVK